MKVLLTDSYATGSVIGRREAAGLVGDTAISMA